MELIKKFKAVKRCKHGHSALTHPRCFDISGNVLEFKPPTLPKVLIFDIETAPLRAFVFQKSVWGGNVGADQVISEWFTLCWSAKWLFDDEVLSARLTPKEAKREDDSRIVKLLWKLLDEADIVIAHNASGFDVPNMNTRLIVNKLPPTSPYQVIDTKQVAKRQFGFTHNSLNALANVFGFEAKMDTDFELWKKCVAGDKEALEYMETYNKGDVILLEKVYLKLRPWVKGHPNLNLYVESENAVCTNCGSRDLELIDKKYFYTGSNKFPLYRCGGCGCYCREKKSALPKKVSKNMLLTLSR